MYYFTQIFENHHDDVVFTKYSAYVRGIPFRGQIFLECSNLIGLAENNKSLIGLQGW